MPVDETAAALVSAAGQAYNADQQRRTNEANRAYSDRQYQRERRDALSDWERNTRYNSPEEQMNRLRQAGLNPNLIYGKGATNTAQSIRASSSKPVSQIAPKINADAPLGALLSYSNMQKVQGETDNLDEQNAVLRAEATLKGAQTAGKVADTATSKFQLKQAQELNDSVIERAKLENDLTSAKRFQMEEQVYLTDQLRKLARKNNILAQLDINLRKQGIMPGDPAWLRIMIQQSKKSGIKLDIPKKFKFKF